MPRTRSKSNSVGSALASHFLVDWGGPSGSQGFARVEIGAIGPTGGGTLALTRAVDGRRDLYLWLRPEAEGRSRRKPAARTVTVTALDGAGNPVARYRFEGAVPVSLALSPLDAREQALLTETLTMSFRGVTMPD